MIRELRANNIDNVNDNSALTNHLNERGIDKDDVISVKHWQSASGDYRFSIVTKEDLSIKESLIFDKVNKFVEEYSPDYTPIKRKKQSEPHLLVINPADIHIGKYASAIETGEEYNSEIAVKRVMEGIMGLIDKAQGFQIEKILFCIGNDVLHVDNVYSTTTKGTPQDTDGKWWEHYELALAFILCHRLRRLTSGPESANPQNITTNAICKCTRHRIRKDHAEQAAKTRIPPVPARPAGRTC